MQNRIKLVFVVILVIVTLMWSFASGREGFSEIEAIDVNSSIVLHETERIPRDEMTMFVVDNDRLYLFYDSVGLVNVYSSKGAFIYGLQVPQMNNGRGCISYIDGVLYVKAKGNIIYLFSDDTLIKHISITEARDSFKEAKERMANYPAGTVQYQEYYYDAVRNEIGRTMPNGETQIIISLPRRSTNTQILAFVQTILIGLLAFQFRKDDSSNQE